MDNDDIRTYILLKSTMDHDYIRMYLLANFATKGCKRINFAEGFKYEKPKEEKKKEEFEKLVKELSETYNFNQVKEQPKEKKIKRKWDNRNNFKKENVKQLLNEQNKKNNL